MQALKNRKNFVESVEGIEVRQMLQMMVADSLYNTESSYSSNTGLYADNLIPFVDKHMNYLQAHPQLDSRLYLTNLRLMTRVRK